MRVVSRHSERLSRSNQHKCIKERRGNCRPTSSGPHAKKEVDVQRSCRDGLHSTLSARTVCCRGSHFYHPTFASGPLTSASLVTPSKHGIVLSPADVEHAKIQVILHRTSRASRGPNYLGTLIDRQGLNGIPLTRIVGRFGEYFRRVGAFAFSIVPSSRDCSQSVQCGIDEIDPLVETAR